MAAYICFNRKKKRHRRRLSFTVVMHSLEMDYPVLRSSKRYLSLDTVEKVKCEIRTLHRDYWYRGQPYEEVFEIILRYIANKRTKLGSLVRQLDRTEIEEVLSPTFLFNLGFRIKKYNPITSEMEWETDENYRDKLREALVKARYPERVRLYDLINDRINRSSVAYLLSEIQTGNMNPGDIIKEDYDTKLVIDLKEFAGKSKLLERKT